MATLRILLVSVLLVAAGCSGSGSDAADDTSGPKLDTDPATLQAEAAEAMGEVTSVKFTLERSGAPVYVDAAQSIALDSLEGRFSEPSSAEALLAVTVNSSLRTKIGAVAIDEEIWLSNPVTGKFETLPPGYDIDPSSFFDPKGGWQPLVESLTDVTFVGEEDRGGASRYHLTGTAPADQIRSVTAGLVGIGGDVDMDLWLNPVSGRATDLEFDTVFNDATSSWVLALTEYGETFEISDPTLEQ